MPACAPVGRVAAGQYTPVMCACTVRRVVGMTRPAPSTPTMPGHCPGAPRGGLGRVAETTAGAITPR